MIDHKHLIIRAEVKNPFVDPQTTKDWLERLVSAINMKITTKLVAKLISEAIKKEKVKKENLPKSSGKLIDLKKNLEALIQLKNELSLAKFSEKTATTEIEFADLAKFTKEYDLIKSKGVTLEKKIDDEIASLKTRISLAQNKIKDLMGFPQSIKNNEK